MAYTSQAGTPERGRRERILDAVLATLSEQKRAATEMKAVVEASDVSLADTKTEFADLDELLVAVAARIAADVSRPLAGESDTGGNGPVDVRSKLIEFGSGLHEAYSSVMVGFMRVVMTEGGRHRDLRKRLFDAGPGAVSSTLQRFLQQSASKGHLDLGDNDFAAELLIGMLRESLYQELTLHSQKLAFYSSPVEAVEAAVDMFLNGCNGAEGHDAAAAH